MFDQLTGNERVKDLLRRMLEMRRVPGALLFSGEEGVGKKLFAFQLAKALNCRSPKGAEACDGCAACLRISKINYPPTDDPDDKKRILWTDHPDVGLVEPPGRFLLVTMMREIEREANFRPYEGAVRFFIVDDADKLNESSANALLKTLEEPPRTSHIVLVTSRPAKLLPTIRSRCQMIRFCPLPASEIERHLAQAKVAEPRIRARSSGGSIGRAFALDLESYRSQRAAMLKVLNALALSVDRSQLLHAAEELNDARRKDEYESRLDLLETLIRDVWMLALGAREDQVVNDDLRAPLLILSQAVASYRAADWISKIEEMREQLAVNINRKVATDALFLSLAGA